MAAKNPRRAGPKSRSGCLRCKQKRQKCDEERPACGRCRRVGLECTFKTAKETGGVAHVVRRVLLPARSGSDAGAPLLIHTPSAYADLQPLEASYFDRFRRLVSLSFVERGYPPQFWYKTTLREGIRDPCVRQCLIAIGALDRALEGRSSHLAAATSFCRNGRGGRGPKPPIYTAELNGVSDWQSHLQLATRSYASALRTLRARVASYESPANIDAGAVRTALIATVMFIMFETMRGNSDAAGQLLTTSIRTFHESVLGSLHKAKFAPWAKVLDDEGLVHGQLFLLRLAGMRGLALPQEPIYPNLWAAELHRVRFEDVDVPLPDEKHDMDLEQSPPSSARLRRFERQQAIVGSQCTAWYDFARLKHKEPSINAATRSMWGVMQYGALTAHIYAQGCLDPTGGSWSRSVSESERIIDHFTGLLDAQGDQFLVPLRGSRGGLPRFLGDYALWAVYVVVSNCRAAAVRRKGLSLVTRLSMPVFEGEDWEAITLLMSLQATCDAEEKSRVGSSDGDIPTEGRYRLLTYKWDEAHTTLTMTNRRVGTEVDEDIVITISDYMALQERELKSKRRTLPRRTLER